MEQQYSCTKALFFWKGNNKTLLSPFWALTYSPSVILLKVLLSYVNSSLPDEKFDDCLGLQVNWRGEKTDYVNYMTLCSLKPHRIRHMCLKNVVWPYYWAYTAYTCAWPISGCVCLSFCCFFFRLFCLNSKIRHICKVEIKKSMLDCWNNQKEGWILFFFWCMEL